MKSRNLKNLLMPILASMLLLSIVLIPSAKALTLNYNDSVWASLSVTGPDLAKPGNVEIYTVLGSLSSNMTGFVYLTLWVNSTSGVQENIFSTYVLSSGSYLAGNSFIQSYQVTIPNDTANNEYVYATLNAGTSQISKIVLTLVQNVTYSGLQSLYIQAQSNIVHLTTEVNSLQNQLNIATANSTNLQQQLDEVNSNYATLLSEYKSLSNSSTSDISTLQSNITALKNQLSSLNSTNNQLQSQITALQTQNGQLQTQLNQVQTDNASLSSEVDTLKQNNTSLQNQVTTLQADKASLLNQTSTLQTQTNKLQFNNTNMQYLINVLNNQTISLQSQVKDLQSKNTSTSILMYLATVIAVIFVVATAYILITVVKRKGKKTEEPPLY